MFNTRKELTEAIRKLMGEGYGSAEADERMFFRLRDHVLHPDELHIRMFWSDGEYTAEQLAAVALGEERTVLKIAESPPGGYSGETTNNPGWFV